MEAVWWLYGGTKGQLTLDGTRLRSARCFSPGPCTGGSKFATLTLTKSACGASSREPRFRVTPSLCRVCPETRMLSDVPSLTTLSPASGRSGSICVVSFGSSRVGQVANVAPLGLRRAAWAFCGVCVRGAGDTPRGFRAGPQAPFSCTRLREGLASVSWRFRRRAEGCI
jgi:hypothetical protein